MSYFAPKPGRTPYNRAGCRIDGDTLEVPVGYRFPSVCLVTGRTVLQEPRRRTHLYVPAGSVPGIWNLIRLFYAQRVSVYYCLCEEVVLKRRILGALAAISFPSIFAVPILLGATDSSLTAIPIFGALAVVCVHLRRPKVSVGRTMLRFTGIHPDVMRRVYEES
jgi:hypothetical protein